MKQEDIEKIIQRRKAEYAEKRKALTIGQKELGLNKERVAMHMRVLKAELKAGNRALAESAPKKKPEAKVKLNAYNMQRFFKKHLAEWKRGDALDLTQVDVQFAIDENGIHITANVPKKRDLSA